MRTLPQDDELLAALLAQHQPRKRGCVSSTIEFACTAAVVCLAVVGGYFLLEIWVDTPAAPATVNSQNGNGTPKGETVSPLPQPRQQPVYVPVPALPSCENVTDSVTACEQTKSDNVNLEPTPTAAPTPTADSGSFWTPEEQTAIAATEQAFYTDIPTPEPTFAAFVNEACADPTKVAQSPLLASWCGDE